MKRFCFLFSFLLIASYGLATKGVSIHGSGHNCCKTAPLASLSPTSLTFPNTTVGQTSAAKTITLTNTGSSTMTISSIVTTGDFSNTTTCGGTLAAAASCTVSVVFSPLSAASLTGATTFTDNAKGSPQTVTLSGVGQSVASPGVSLSTTTLNFGQVIVGKSSTAQSVVLTNIGTATLNIASIGITGDYSKTTTCAATLAASASCTVSVTFTPTTTGSRTGTLTFTDDSATSPETVSLTGSGATGSPIANLSASSLAFDNQQINTTSAAQVLTLTNTGTGTLTIGSIVTTGNFADTTTCGGTLAIGANCTVSVTFTPLSAAALTGAVTFTDDAANSPQVVTLSGTGTNVTPATYLFPNGGSAPWDGSSFTAWGAQTHPELQTISVIPSTSTPAAQLHYSIAAGGAASQDINVWMGATFTPVRTLYAKGDFYQKSPEPDATHVSYTGRKLIWLSDSTSANNNVGGQYQVILGSFSATGGTQINGLSLTWASQGVSTCHTSSPVYWDLATLNYDTTYTIEFEVVLNSVVAGVAQSDGEVHLWINGSNVYNATGLNTINQACTGDLQQVSLGEQLNRYMNDVANEYRYWTNFSISTTGP
jgi:hypothetical protein